VGCEKGECLTPKYEFQHGVKLDVEVKRYLTLDALKVLEEPNAQLSRH
jgi:hypothetical protein